MTLPTSPQTPRCVHCKATLESYDVWFGGDCPNDPDKVHDLPGTLLEALAYWRVRDNDLAPRPTRLPKEST